MWICIKCGAYDEDEKPDFPKYHREICNGIVQRTEKTQSIWSEKTGGAE